MTVRGTTGCDTVSGGPGIRLSTGSGTGGGTMRGTRVPAISAQCYYPLPRTENRSCRPSSGSLIPPSLRARRRSGVVTGWRVVYQVAVGIRYEVESIRSIRRTSSTAPFAPPGLCWPVNLACATESLLAPGRPPAAARSSSSGAISPIELRRTGSCTCRTEQASAYLLARSVQGACTDVRETHPASRAELLSLGSRLRSRCGLHSSPEPPISRRPMRM